MWQVCAFAGIPAAGLALHGILLRRHGVRPRSLLIIGVFTVVFLLALLLVAWGNLVMYMDEQSGFSEHLPGWREEVTTGILGAAALIQLAALPLLARRGAGAGLRDPSEEPSRPVPRALDTGRRIVSALPGTRVDVEQGRTAVLVAIR
ncbi:hypothetical protein GCM10022419_119020 [Nonomuraea rosea]|uniref:Uncharacterized protein n=2 Tax=Nonomuraea rosea TaxID=638574 RepID=A0ABP6ZR82_9ACTN